MTPINQEELRRIKVAADARGMHALSRMVDVALEQNITVDSLLAFLYNQAALMKAGTNDKEVTT